MSLVRTEVRDHVGTVTLDNLSKRNALSGALVGELVDALEGMQELKVRAIVVRAPGGSKVWSAGHDVRELPVSGRDPLAYDDPLLVAIRKIQYLPIPVIAMIEGAVWGGACDLAFSCDILVGCPTTSFTMTPAKSGGDRPQQPALDLGDQGADPAPLDGEPAHPEHVRADPGVAPPCRRQPRRQRGDPVLPREAAARLHGGSGRPENTRQRGVRPARRRPRT